MASQAPNMLPLLYNGLEALNRNLHANYKVRRLNGLDRVASTHAIPVTVDEFAMIQRHFPIVFSAGESPVPIALMGLHEGTNTFFDEKGVAREGNVYLPAYLRRFPFVLARLREDSDELSLCFDPTSGAVGEFSEGEPLFEGENPSEATNAILQFCEQFEQAGQRTQFFMNELKEAGLLMEGEVAIQPEGSEQPFIYRGFQMVDEEKFRNLRGDELRKLNQNGALPLIMAHLFSLSVIREIFARQVQQGTGPIAAPQPVPAEA
ncbi:SapC family protein [Sphingomonas sp. G124]|uniref:SapC family protein n=1 Tax=Sphingomonas cremea TaxID=2904799 RepID=A0A9X1TWX7_9SPHN|nr:SapC family protein [Sphingomonas cremea]MCF2514540.1 SapC family protein [Sphingomonas cremea]